MSISNKARGEVSISIGKKQYNLCLTLGALAELETAFAAGNLTELAEKMRNFSARDFLIVLMILLKGGANELSLEELKAMPIDFKDASEAINTAFTNAFSD